MRRGEHVGQLEQRVLARWLGREHVEDGAAQPLGLERLQQRLLVHHAAARAVDEHRVGLHSPERGRADHATRAGIERHVE